ncbi:hypothetical protein BC939DRAFT_241221 [Gamsiella multidivaricata]|uniref:uncharacterized protein n=1 Tax=Gamsiella multidivaricata TaxID=101098 RepID=UPI00221E5FD6|nr:uncharacterized protein BC939DRAFT_241221 [Gamsiella multidivaricata]KAI7820178.1 hypothetical protein BC939DRAFT_241221 [Gamsiella multidivaricata]
MAFVSPIIVGGVVVACCSKVSLCITSCGVVVEEEVIGNKPLKDGGAPCTGSLSLPDCGRCAYAPTTKSCPASRVRILISLGSTLGQSLATSSLVRTTFRISVKKITGTVKC